MPVGMESSPLSPHLRWIWINLKRFDPQQGYANRYEWRNYLATHDRQRVMRIRRSRYFDAAAFNGEVRAALLITAMGVPMLWMGEEFGERKSETVTQPKKIAWPLLSRDLNQDLFEFHKHLIALRKQSIAPKRQHWILPRKSRQQSAGIRSLAWWGWACGYCGELLRPTFNWYRSVLPSYWEYGENWWVMM